MLPSCIGLCDWIMRRLSCSNLCASPITRMRMGCALEESTTNKPIDNNVIYDMHSTWWFGQHVRHFQAQLRNGLNKKWVLMLTVFAVKCDNFNCNHHFAEIVHTQRDEKRDTRAHVSHKIELSLCASSPSSCVQYTLLLDQNPIRRHIATFSNFGFLFSFRVFSSIFFRHRIFCLGKICEFLFIALSDRNSFEKRSRG